MAELFESLIGLFVAVFQVVRSLASVVLPYLPLIAWVAFWLFAVNWVKFYEVLFRKGGIIGVMLICLVWILIWGLIAPPLEGTHSFFGLQLSNFVAKTVYVLSLVVIMFLCGSAQMAGFCGTWCRFSEAEEPPTVSHGHAGHSGHGEHAVAHGH